MGHGGKRIGAGRKVGSVSAHTLEAMKVRERMRLEVSRQITPIINSLIIKAKGGDVAAARELMDRAFGRPPRAVAMIAVASLPVPIMNIRAYPQFAQKN